MGILKRKYHKKFITRMKTGSKFNSCVCNDCRLIAKRITLWYIFVCMSVRERGPIRKCFLNYAKMYILRLMIS